MDKLSSSLALIAVATILAVDLFIIVMAVAHGRVFINQREFRRTDHPFWYWFGIAFGVAVAIVLGTLLLLSLVS
jgi:hypothetical protein